MQIPRDKEGEIDDIVELIEEPDSYWQHIFRASPNSSHKSPSSRESSMKSPNYHSQYFSPKISSLKNSKGKSENNLSQYSSPKISSPRDSSRKSENDPRHYLSPQLSSPSKLLRKSPNYHSHYLSPLKYASQNGSPPLNATGIPTQLAIVIEKVDGYSNLTNETRYLVDTIFAPGSGISNDEITTVLKTRVSTKLTFLDGKLAAANELVKLLELALVRYNKGKNEIVAKLLENTKAVRNGWKQSIASVQILHKDRTALQTRLKQLEDNSKHWHDLSKEYITKIELLDENYQDYEVTIDKLNLFLDERNNINTFAGEKLKIEKSRSEDYEEQYKSEHQSHAQTNTKTATVSSKNTELETETKVLKCQLSDQVRQIGLLSSKIAQYLKATADAKEDIIKHDKEKIGMLELKTEIKSVRNLLVIKEESHSSDILGRDTDEKADKGQIEERNGELLHSRKSLSEMNFDLENSVKNLSLIKANINSEKELQRRSEKEIIKERNEFSILSTQIETMVREYFQMNATINDSNTALELQWKNIVEAEQEKSKKLNDENTLCKKTIISLEEELKTMQLSRKHRKKNALTNSTIKIGKLSSELSTFQEKIEVENQKEMSPEMNRKIQLLEQQVSDGHNEKKRLSDLIDELKDKLKVFVRIRPFLHTENVMKNVKSSILSNNEVSLNLYVCNNTPQTTQFHFDRVFSPNTDQEGVFTEVSEFVQSAIDGCNVCILSYGDIGSGKTHTLQGVGKMRGILPRAIKLVADRKHQFEKDGWKHESHVSFLEIQNETIRDLLGESKTWKHQINQTKDGDNFVTNLTMLELQSQDTESVENLLRRVSSDLVSTKSHSIITLHLTAFHAEQKKVLRGTLRLVDLASSERTTSSINKSLNSLSNVFDALSRKAKHVPFRDSKLTYLLQPCLNDDGRTLLLANLSPNMNSIPETMRTLRFASRVCKHKSEDDSLHALKFSKGLNEHGLGFSKRYLDVTDDEVTAIISLKSGSIINLLNESRKKQVK